MEKKKRWSTVYLGKNLSCNLVFVYTGPTVFCFFLMVGTKQTSALNQEDASQRYENYIDSCFHLSVNLILIEPFVNSVIGATSEKII